MKVWSSFLFPLSSLLTSSRRFFSVEFFDLDDEIFDNAVDFVGDFFGEAEEHLFFFVAVAVIIDELEETCERGQWPGDIVREFVLVLLELFEGIFEVFGSLLDELFELVVEVGDFFVFLAQ